MHMHRLGTKLISWWPCYIIFPHTEYTKSTGHNKLFYTSFNKMHLKLSAYLNVFSISVRHRFAALQNTLIMFHMHLKGIFPFHPEYTYILNTWGSTNPNYYEHVCFHKSQGKQTNCMPYTYMIGQNRINSPYPLVIFPTRLHHNKHNIQCIPLTHWPLGDFNKILENKFSS